MSADEPERLGSLYHADGVWDAYDSEDQDARRARWIAILTRWMLGHDEKMHELLDPLTLAELIDFDASLTGLRHEVRRVIVAMDAPWTANTRPEPDRS